LGTYRPSIAIVGHGPSLIGAGMGPRIDNHDLVIRMAECDWQRKLGKDYGRKYDYGIDSINQITCLHHQNPNWKPKYLYWLYSPKSNSNIIKSTVYGEKAIIVGFHIEQYRRESRCFTRGTAAAIISIILYEAAYLTLFGFDMVLLGSAMEPEKRHPIELRKFRENKLQAKDRSTAGKHDWINERQTILNVAEEHGTVVIFAPEPYVRAEIDNGISQVAMRSIACSTS